MARPITTMALPPMIDPSRQSLAYGSRCLPRLNAELNDKDNVTTRQRAIRSLSDLLRDPEIISQAIEEGMVTTLKKLLRDDDILMRLKTTECFFILASHGVGRQALMRDNGIDWIAKLFEDPEDDVRKNCHLAIEMIAEHPIGAAGIYESELVSVLVHKLTMEIGEIKVPILDTLHWCMLVDTAEILGCNGMRIFTNLLIDDMPEIRARAARDIMDLSITLEGKNKAVEEKCMESLVRNLRDEDTDVRCYSAGAIMMIAVTTKGKYTAIGADAVAPLADLVDDPCSEVRMNSLKALTCLAEAPEGREEMLIADRIKRVRVHLQDPVPGVARAAKIAVSVIEWQP